MSQKKKTKEAKGPTYLPRPDQCVPAKCYRCGEQMGGGITALLAHYAKAHPGVDLSK